MDNAVRTSHKLSWRSLILLNTLWAHAVRRNMLPSRECLTQRGTTSSKSSNDGAPLLTSDLSKRIALGGEENIPCMVLKPQRISWKLSFLKGTSVGYMNRHHGFSIKARSVQCVCVCVIVEIQRPAMKIWVCVWVVNTEQVIKLWPLRAPECCRTDAWVTLAAFISLCLLTSLSLSLRFCLSETAQYVKTIWTLCSEAYWNTET